VKTGRTDNGSNNARVKSVFIAHKQNPEDRHGRVLFYI